MRGAWIVEADEYEPTVDVSDSMHIQDEVRLATPVILRTMALMCTRATNFDKNPVDGPHDPHENCFALLRDKVGGQTAQRVFRRQWKRNWEAVEDQVDAFVHQPVERCLGDVVVIGDIEVAASRQPPNCKR